MRIQIINFSEEKVDGNIIYTKIAAPRSLDEFDLNIIDLSSESLWYFGKSNNKPELYSINDLISINTMIMNSTKAFLLFVLPQDISLHIHTDTTYDHGRPYKHYSSRRIKDSLPIINQSVFSVFGSIYYAFETAYENTETTINGFAYKAGFFFTNCINAITVSDGSNKPTTAIFGEKYFFTTLDILASSKILQNFISFVFPPLTLSPVPTWMDNIMFYDDDKQISIIKKQEEIIRSAKEAINDANSKLEINKKIKSILYSTGDELVSVVFEILEHMINCDLSDFIDKKREDFLIKKQDYTLIGEIKGIGTNVKNDNVTQLEVHYQHYLDELQESGCSENVHQVLIINPLRNKPLSEREPIHEHQINLAVRNNALIIETRVLLRLYESFLRGEKTVEDCEKLLTTRTGLLKEELL